MPVVSISLPKTLLEKIDEAVEKYGYTGRSELIREAVREHLQSLNSLAADKPVYALIVALTDTSISRQASYKIMEIVHARQESVKAYYHQSIGRLCLNIILARASPAEIRYMLGELRRTRGVRRVWLTLVTEEAEEREDSSS